MTKDKFYKYLTNFIGFLIIIIIFWNRFIRDRINKVLSFGITKEIYIFLVIFIILILILLLLNTILEVTNKKASKLFDIIKKNKYYVVYLRFVAFIKNSPKTFYKTFVFDNFNIADVVEVPVFFVVKKLAKKPKDFIYIMFVLVPRILVSIIFFLSVFYFNNLNYFYKSLVLLCLPLLYNIYLYITTHLSDCNIEYFSEHLLITPAKEKGFFDIEIADKIPDFPDAINVIKHKYNTELLKWLIYNYDVYTNIKNFTIKLEKIEQKYKPYENLFVYACYLIGWCYILYQILS